MVSETFTVYSKLVKNFLDIINSLGCFDHLLINKLFKRIVFFKIMYVIFNFLNNFLF